MDILLFQGTKYLIVISIVRLNGVFVEDIYFGDCNFEFRG